MRSELAKLDQEITQLLDRRTQLAADLWNLHRENSKVASPFPQEDATIERCLAARKGPLPEQSLKAILREVLAAARAANRKQRVAYLGPEHSYSHLATIERFGHSVELTPVMSIGAVFEAVNRNDVDLGVVPLENSSDGRIVDTLEMFTRLPVRIRGEVPLRIHHYLLAKCSRSEITQVYSKQQALSQCRDWLSRHLPHARTIAISSTAAAAELARDRAGTAAIASREAGVHYGLDVVAEKIEDNLHNLTRFAVIGNEVAARTGKDKTAVMFQVPHKPGSLADAMMVFKKNNLNLTWIESFPVPGLKEGYLFFVEFEGHESEEASEQAIRLLEKRALRLEILGSFPMTQLLPPE